MLLLATASRLQSRLQSGLADATAQVVTEAELAAQKLQQEWELFWEEVRLEAERLERPGDGGAPQTEEPPSPPPSAAQATNGDGQGESAGKGHPTEPTPQHRASPAEVQETIDQLRAEVAALNQRLEKRAL